MNIDNELKITGVTVRPVIEPMARALQTASGKIEQASLVLIARVQSNRTAIENHQDSAF